MKYFENGNLNFDIQKLGDHEIVIAIPAAKAKSWTLSLNTAIGPMLREEIGREKLGLKGVLFKGLSYFFQAFGAALQIDKAIYPCHFGFSTTLYRRGEIASILKAKDELKRQYKDKAIIVRSLNSINFRGREKDFCLIPSRVIFIIEDLKTQWFERKDTKSDLKLFEKHDIELKNYSKNVPPEILEQCKHLYDDLYLQKYSKFNPDFTIEYLRELIDSSILKLHVIHARSGKVLAFCATQKSDSTISCPLLGYDRNSGIPLFRAIMSIAPMVAMQAGLKLNHSAGSPIFKKNRGAIAMMEYSLVIYDHLPPLRRFGYWLLGKTLRSFEKEILKAANK